MQHTWSDGFVTIRPYEIADVPELFAAAVESAADVSPWLPWLSDGYTQADSEDWIETSPPAWQAGERFSFAVTDAATGRYLGGVGLNDINHQHRFCGLGYWVRTTETGRGVATAAARLCAEFALRELEFVRVEILVDMANSASQRVAEKVGCTREGVARDRIWLRGQSHDAVVFSLLPSDLDVGN